MRIGLYARVSTRDKGQDHENQLRELREFVKRKAPEGWVLATEYVDHAHHVENQACCSRLDAA
jgi:DNA invertase Pin-like site-specific DNA recombinase